MRIQRWSVRRIVLTVAVLVAAFMAIGLTLSNWAVFT
jgi:hypothetical protein